MQGKRGSALKTEQLPIVLAASSSLRAIVALAVSQVRKDQRKSPLWLLPDRDQSGLALVRYVQLNRRCSEEVAYQRLAAFVKKHIPLDDYPDLERVVAYDRSYLLERAQSLLRHDPDELENI